MAFIGIDPGKGGACAIIHDDASVHVFPFDETVYRDMLHKVAYEECVRGAVVERVSAMPKQGVTSMFNFGVNYGYIQGLLAANNVPFELVTPAKWKKEFGVTSDKNTSIAVARRLFPQASLLPTPRCKKPNDGMAEALLMAEYARRKMGGVVDG